MTKYSVDIFTGNTTESIALFSNACDLDAMIAFCRQQFELGNSLTTPADNIAIIDLTTGEVMWEWASDDDLQALLEDGAHIVNGEPMYPIDIEVGFNPFMGGYDYDC